MPTVLAAARAGSAMTEFIASVSEFLAIHKSEQLELHRPLCVKELYVHLGDPGPTIDVGDHDLQYGKVEFHGKGVFRVLRHGMQLWRYEQ